MRFFFTPHSKRRFKERYGFEPTIGELSEIAGACQSGEALQMREASADGARTFRVKIRGVNVYPVLSADAVLITFLPPDFFLSSVAKAHRQQKHGGKAGRYHLPDSPRPYKRARASVEFGDES